MAADVLRARTIVDAIRHWAGIDGERDAIADAGATLTYSQLLGRIGASAALLRDRGIGRSARVAVVADKTLDSVVALFACLEIGAIAVPINPALKPAQVDHVVADCDAALLIDADGQSGSPHRAGTAVPCVSAAALADAARSAAPAAPLPQTDADVAMILYTSGSTGRPKGVVLSQRNLVAGAQSVAEYLGNDANDRLLAALPLSFDAGLSQLTTAFVAGAFVQLHRYWLPQDCLRLLAEARITGLTAVPPLWMQLARLDGFADAWAGLRYFATTGGAMPAALLGSLRKRAPQARPFLMYGLTEAFRSSFLPPEEIDRRADSIGRAMPNTELFVLRPDGARCAPGEVGELVHRGATVALGYWGDAALTARKFRPLPAELAPMPGERAVWSGDLVRQDADGFLYFVSRGDEQIKTSGYRVSPTEIEEVVYASGLVAECAAFGVADPALGQSIVVVAAPAGAAAPADGGAALIEQLRRHCQRALPPYMVPAHFDLRAQSLPHTPNGKIDRLTLAKTWRAGSPLGAGA